MYNRDGTPRGSWIDPLGFAGLDTVPPPPEQIAVLEQRITELQQREKAIAVELPERARDAEELGVELSAMAGNPHLAQQFATLSATEAEVAGTARALRREQAEIRALEEALGRRLQHMRAGERDDPRAHITKLARPVSTEQMRFNRLAEAWAAVSLSLLLIGVVLIYFFERRFLWLGAVVLVLVFLVFESILRGTFVKTINRIAVFLAILASLVLLFHFWAPILVGALVIGVGFLLVQKVRELRG
jgi:hypothetical protein